jgi:signal transduction histidine kinase
MSPTIRSASAVAFGVVAVVLLVISATGYRTAQRSAEANRSVAHTYQVLDALERVWRTTTDAETGVRGFVITGVRQYLDAFDHADEEFRSRIDAVSVLTADNPVQRGHIVELRSQTRAAMQVLQQMVSLAEKDEAILPDLSDREQRSMDAVRATLQRMRTDEQQLMVQHNQDASTADVRTTSLMTVLIASAFGVLALSFLFVDRGAVQLARLNASLSERVRERTVQLEQSLSNEQQARAEADAANQSKDVFLARVSHELRTPLNALMGWARMLRDGQVPPDRTPRAIAAIDRNGDLLTTLVEDLIDVSRVTTGSLQLNRQHVDVAGLAEESLTLVEAAASAKGVEIRTDIESRSMIVDGDPTRLRQVMWNLLSNAIKFTPARGHVTFSVHSVDHEVEIRVADDGQGITSDFLPRVFEPFSQADPTGGRGLGLGLAIVHQLVNAHDGRIDAMSGGTGAGTTFTVRFPMVEVSEPV